MVFHIWFQGQPLFSAGIFQRWWHRVKRRHRRPKATRWSTAPPSQGDTMKNCSSQCLGFQKPLVNIQKTMERSTMLLMGKSTISTGPFSIAMLNYQRVDQKTHCGTTKTTFCLQVYVQRKSWWNWGQCWFPHSASTLAFTEGLENMSQFLGVDFPVFWWRWFWCMPLTTKAYGLLSKLRQEPWQSLKSA